MANNASRPFMAGMLEAESVKGGHRLGSTSIYLIRLWDFFAAFLRGNVMKKSSSCVMGFIMRRRLCREHMLQ